MYKAKNKEQLEFENFYIPFGGKLRSDNRWIRLAKIIPWEELETHYACLFSKDMGAPAKTFRMALGSLIIKEKLNITDEETVEQIRENPYLQYFIGLSEYTDKAPFDASMMVHYRKRLSQEVLSKINDIIVNGTLSKRDKNNKNDKGNGDSFCSSDDRTPKAESGEDNAGIMIVDASVAPADITYPTDLNLLNESREKCEEIIDKLYEQLKGRIPKPRTYRHNARRDYLRAIKRRKHTQKGLRKALRQQLQYIRRDIHHIEALIQRGAVLEGLTRQQYRNLLVVGEVYRQQKQMYDENRNSIADRIVNISQPHVRPIVRGKAQALVEFGAKIFLSRINGYHILDAISWDNINESTLLIEQIKRYKQRMGYYPEAVLADKIYRTGENLRFCKEHNIHLSGPRLGCLVNDNSYSDKQEQADRAQRNAIEGSFGTGKRRYGLGRIMMKLKETNETSISLIILVMNLEKRLKLLLSLLYK
jgi:hypothetical protein